MARGLSDLAGIAFLVVVFLLALLCDRLAGSGEGADELLDDLLPPPADDRPHTHVDW